MKREGGSGESKQQGDCQEMTRVVDEDRGQQRRQAWRAYNDNSEFEHQHHVLAYLGVLKRCGQVLCQCTGKMWFRTDLDGIRGFCMELRIQDGIAYSI